MADNLEEFLRKAAERRQQRTQQQRPAGQPMQPPQQPLMPPSPPPQSTISSRQVPPPSQQPKPKPKPEVASQKRPAPQAIGDSWKARPNLAQRVEASDDSMQSHLQQVFDHQLGQLQSSAPSNRQPATKSPKADGPNAEASKPVESTLAQQVVAAFRDPQSTKIAFIASEIFQRRF